VGLRPAQAFGAAIAVASLAGCGAEVEPVTEDAMFDTSLGLLPTDTFADFALPKSRGTERKGKITGYDKENNRVLYVMPRFSDEEVEKFDFHVTLGRIDNNKPDAGLRQALQIAKSRCDLPALPTSEEVDMTQGFTLYFTREYFFRCPAAEKEIQ
jgi:hypothetical protein